MKRKILTICLVVFLLPFAIVCGSEKTEGISVAEKAFQLRLDGKSHRAKEMLSEYLKEHPEDAVAQFEYSRVLGYLFDFEQAEKHAALAVQQDPTDARYHYWQGMCGTYHYIDQAHHKGNLDSSILKQSIAALQKAIELKPDYYEARFLLVNLLNNNEPDQGGDQKKARKHTEYLMEKDLVYGLQAMMVIEGEKSLDWKIGQYQEALAKEPDNAGLHAGIALLYANSDQIEKSQEHINKAIELDNCQKDVLLDVIFPLAKKKDYETAKSLVRRYLELAADESAAMRAFGTFYLAKLEKMSGGPNADKTLEQSRQIDPNVWMTMKAPPAMLFEPLK
ncbi:MAG: tetratricopeptide repeat protein [Planctomycetota bacterium]